MLDEVLRVLDPKGAIFILDYQRPSTTSGQAARIVEYLVEWGVGGEHFRNYRQFMKTGALPGFLAHMPPDRVCWESLFHGSLSLVKIQREQGTE